MMLPMTSDASPDPPPDASPGRARRLVARFGRWVDPEDNPQGLVYGTLAVSAVLAAESTRRETFADTVGATALVLTLYWLAHAYANVVGRRLERQEGMSLGGLWQALRHEGAIVKGAAIPIAVVVALWGARVTLATAVNAALWTSAVVLATFEIMATVRSRVTGVQMAVQGTVGLALGAGVLAVRLILH